VKPERVYAWYFVLQSVVGVALWMAFASSSTVRSWFDLISTRHVVANAFLYPDMAVIVVGSVLSAWALGAEAPSAVPWTAFTAGGVLYPTFYLLGWVVLGGDTGARTLAIMIPPSILTSWIAYQVWMARR
jgi:hypothetical protein